MGTHGVQRGIDVTYHDGSGEHVSCDSWWTGDQVLHTASLLPVLKGGEPSHIALRGPSFPFVSIRKWEETR